MQALLMGDGPASGRVFLLVLATGEEVVAALREFAAREKLTAGQVTGIGAFSDVTLAFFDWPSRQYRPIPVLEQVEVVTFAGNVTRYEDQPRIHAHVVVSKSDGTTVGGHLVEAHVRPTLEVVLTEFRRPVYRRVDPESGLALIDVDAGL